MLKKELNNLMTMNPEERATAREIAVDAYETAHSANGIVYADDPSDSELIATIDRILPEIKDDKDIDDLKELKEQLEATVAADWIRERERFFDLDEVVCKLTDVDYKKYKTGLNNLNKKELDEIRNTMKRIVRDEFKF